MAWSRVFQCCVLHVIIYVEWYVVNVDECVRGVGIGSWNVPRSVRGLRSPTQDSTSRHVTQHDLVDRCRLICDVFSNQETSVCRDDISATCRQLFKLRREKRKMKHAGRHYFHCSFCAGPVVVSLARGHIRFFVYTIPM